MILVNFSHELEADQQAVIVALTRQHISRIVDVAVAINEANDLMPQVVSCVDQAGLTAAEWLRTIINPPAYAPVTAAVIAEVHGRVGHFPTIIRMRPVTESLPRQYEVAEIIDLQAVRLAARSER